MVFEVIKTNDQVIKTSKPLDGEPTSLLQFRFILKSSNKNNTTLEVMCVTLVVHMFM